MKKLFVVFLTVFALSAWARPPHHNHNSGGWIAPLVFGGIVGYAISQSQAQAAAPPIMAPAPCPMGYVPVTERVWIQDSYGRYIQVDRIVGCR